VATDEEHAPVPSGLIGAAGEYYVAAELSLLGWLATVTIKNAPGTDVLAQHLGSGRVIAVQTKTRTGGNFQLGARDEVPTARDNEWYALVELADFPTSRQRPTFYFVPRNVVAALLYTGHNRWLARPGLRGQQRNDSKRRSIHPSDVQWYREKWELLVSPTTKAGVHLDK
jgi:hypothetical protein